MDAPEAGMLVQFAGLLHVLLLADSHVCDRPTDGTAAIAAARIVERLKALPKGTISFFTARMLVRFRKIWKVLPRRTSLPSVSGKLAAPGVKSKENL